MAGAEKIQQKILKEARQQAQKDIEQAEKEAAAIIKSAEQEALEKKETFFKKGLEDAAEHKKRLVAVAQLDARKQRLQAKQDVLQAAFDGALNQLISLPKEKYQSVLIDMVVAAIKTGQEEVIVCERDKKGLTPDFIKAINTQLLNKGMNSAVKLSDETREIKGGFILRQDNIEVNHSFEMITRMQRDVLETQVIKVLF